MQSWAHILKFDGVFYYNGLPAIVTAWMPAGSITEYLEEYTGANRFELVTSSVLPVSGISSICSLSPSSFLTQPKESRASTSLT